MTTESRRIANKKWRDKNKEYHRLYIKSYKPSEAQKIRQKSRVRNARKERLLIDINYKLKIEIRNKTKEVIRKITKPKKENKYFGCTLDELKTHIEKQFKEGMDWNNRSSWHIDHIKPLSSFDLTDKEQFYEACHYTNLQPLWPRENIRKSNKYIKYKDYN
jgi:hypothetical protein